MKKIGLICLAVVLAVGVIGIGFAHWSQSLFIDGTVTTGELKVGIRDAGTSDPSVDAVGAPIVTNDKMFDSDTATITQLTKDVGAANSVNGEEKCLHGDPAVQYYEDITFTVTNAYPQYYWEEYIEIANCGDIPVKLASIEYWDYYATPQGWAPLAGADSFTLWSGLLSDDIWLGSYSLTFPGGSASGTWWHELWVSFVTLNTQLDPCDVAYITLGFFLYEDETSIPDMNATSTMKLKVTFTQWNKVP